MTRCAGCTQKSPKCTASQCQANRIAGNCKCAAQIHKAVTGKNKVTVKK